jgi:hypothetical protein
MKNIQSLVPDIYDLFKGQHVFNQDNIDGFAQLLAAKLKSKLGDVQKPRLRMSNIGTPCRRKLYYSINLPQLGEELPPPVKIKFIFGDILETLLIFLAREAGHTVTGEQTVLDIDGVKGSRDCVIDGVLVDTKSASSYSFDKFSDHLDRENDSFGYIDQLGAYLNASLKDPIVIEKDVAAFLVIDKTKGKLCLDVHPVNGVDYPQRVKELRGMLQEEVPPPRGYHDQREGESGNRKLALVCSYCDFKNTCWPGLRTFLYAKGPVFLTKVERVPKVPEVDRNGNVIHG